MFKITKEFHFEAAHILEGHEGQCINLHGHSYRLLITVGAKKCDDDGMVMDFADLKKIVQNNIINKIDHSFCYNVNSLDAAENEIAATLKKHGRKLYPLDTRPTAENFCKHFFEVLSPLLIAEDIKLNLVTLYETPTSFCQYSGEKE